MMTIPIGTAHFINADHLVEAKWDDDQETWVCRLSDGGWVTVNQAYAVQFAVVLRANLPFGIEAQVA